MTKVMQRVGQGIRDMADTCPLSFEPERPASVGYYFGEASKYLADGIETAKNQRKAEEADKQLEFAGFSD